jgi:molybdopterin/thiamine biosynthesis adenylyltransferase
MPAFMSNCNISQQYLLIYGVNKLFQDCGVQKLTVVDSGSVAVSNLARQSLYTSDDRGAPKAAAIRRHLSERCSLVVTLHFP